MIDEDFINKFNAGRERPYTREEIEAMLTALGNGRNGELFDLIRFIKNKLNFLKH